MRAKVLVVTSLILDALAIPMLVVAQQTPVAPGSPGAREQNRRTDLLLRPPASPAVGPR